MVANLSAIYSRLLTLWDNFNPGEGWLWLLNFSGGKDSSLLLASVIDFLNSKGCLDRLLVVHEDTTIELPQVHESVKEVFRRVRDEGARTVILETEENFFTLMLRRGYSFPKWNFRWCCRVYKYGMAKRFIKSLPQEKILNLLAIRGDEATRIHGEWIREEKVYGKRIVTSSPLIDLDVRNVWDTLRAQYPDFYGGLRRIYMAKADGLGCWACTVIREDPATLALDPHLYELKVRLCNARCASLGRFIEALRAAVRERPDAFPRFRWPEEPRDVKCRGKCGSCQIRRAWRGREAPRYIVQPCWERSDMLHVVFARAEDGLEAAKKLPAAEVHEGGRILCVPKNLMRLLKE